MGADKIEPQEKSIIDRSVGNIYREYLKNYQGQPPTLKDLYLRLCFLHCWVTGDTIRRPTAEILWPPICVKGGLTW